MKQRIALIIAFEGYHPIEYIIPKKIFEDAGHEVVTVSNKKGMATAKDRSQTAVELTLREVDPTDFEALVLVGGPGALDNLDNDTTYALIQKAVMADKAVAAICISPRILAKAGALVTKQATGWNDDGLLKEIFDKHAAIFSDDEVVTDGKVVTAAGPSQAESFAYHVLQVL